MMLYGSEIQQFIKAKASSAVSIRIAAPFWGADAIDLLGLKKTPEQTETAFRLICNLESGACNPAPIRKLKNKLRWGARTHNRLHAKVYIFDDCAVVGDLSPNFHPPTSRVPVTFEPKGLGGATGRGAEPPA